MHCKHRISTGNCLLGLIKLSCISTNSESLVKLYTALVYPHLQYAITVWYPVYKKDSSPFEIIQYKRVHKDMTELFKHTTGIYEVDAEYIKLNRNITKGNNKKLKKQNTTQHCEAKLIEPQND